MWKFSEAKRNKRFRKILTKQGRSKGDFLLFCFDRLLYITASCSLPKKVFLPFPQGRKSKLFFYSRHRSNALVSVYVHFKTNSYSVCFVVIQSAQVFRIPELPTSQYRLCFIAHSHHKCHCDYHCSREYLSKCMPEFCSEIIEIPIPHK